MEAGKEFTTSSGVTLRIVPMAYRLLRRYESFALREWPDPEVPTKQIDTLTGPETVENRDDPQYAAEKAAVERRRQEYMTERTIEDCALLDLAPWEKQIKRLEVTTGEEYPTDPFERRVRFLTEFAMRTGQDYQAVTAIAVGQATVGDEEVERLLRQFRRALAQRAGDAAKAPGADAAERVDVPEAVP
jgi:hypothetical protein